MKIAVRGGHNFQAPGASALIDETTEDRKVKDSVIKYLQQLGHTVLDVTPGNMDTDSDLVYGVNKANSWGADLFISIHFNKAYNSYTGAIGTETWVYSTTDNYNDEEYAKRIVDAIAGLGLKNRGVKTSTGLYELKSTTMPSVIVEVCFVEATEDVALYKKLGPDKIGQVIAEAISNKKISNQNNVEVKEEKKVKGIVIYSNDVDRRAAEYLADYLKLPTIYAGNSFDYTTVEQEGIYAVGGNKGTYTAYLLDKNFISGANRYETVKEVLKRIGKL
ncbi:N-acetylmuramoyl-L-alanine amidase [Clostridium tertium]